MVVMRLPSLILSVAASIVCGCRVVPEEATAVTRHQAACRLPNCDIIYVKDASD